MKPRGLSMKQNRITSGSNSKKDDENSIKSGQSRMSGGASAFRRIGGLKKKKSRVIDRDRDSII